VGFVGYALCECSEHGTVCAKHFVDSEGGGTEVHSYSCPGVRGDTGGCNAALISRGGACEPPDWAEYPDERG